MKTYSVLFAEEVPHYGVADIEAENDAAALEVAKAHDFSDVALDAEREYTGCRRIVHIEDPDGNILHEDVPLDEWSIRYGDEKEQRLWDAAPALLDTVKAPDLDRAHDRLSELLEDSSARYDAIRDSAIDLCLVLNAHYQKRTSAIAKATGDRP